MTESDSGRRTMRRNIRELPATAWFLIAGSSINKFGSFVVPFLVLYLTHAKGFSIAQAGTAVAGYGVGEVAAGFVGGYLADRISRRNTIALSMFSSAAAMIALSQADTFGPVLALAFVTCLVSEARRPAVLALLTDVVPSEQRVTMFAVTRLAENAAFASGIALGGFLANHDFLWLFFGDAASSVVFGLIALTILPEGRRTAKGQEREAGGYRTMLSNRGFLLFLAATVLLAFVYFQLATLPLHVRRSGLSNADFGLLLSLNGVLVMLFELPLSSFIMRRPPKEMIALGFLLVGLGFGLTAVAHNMVALGATVAIWTLGEMIGAPVSYAYVSELAPEHMQGRYQGLYGVTFSSGAIFGPALGTLIYAHAATGFWALCGGAGLAASLLVLATRTPRAAPPDPAVVPDDPPDDITIVLSEAEPATNPTE